ncbi:MFS transporter [Leucobacter triazinivorans]|uniref:MFS transporter n=1 Tax=Leucobacter triazinivorans TaxID=1784719 RepID=A0A4P6KCH3_9MICO|nr:MFS transporter [Leucobacter triazinivorans]QBE47957.1 MFS transporter [Leucobacter triazinivorans]
MAPSRVRWWVLAVGLLAQTFTSMLQFGLPFLHPQLFSLAGSSAEIAALLIAAPSVGLVASLFAWGWVADRHGERPAMVLGLGSGALALGSLALLLGARQYTPVPVVWWGLFLSSALLASVNSASGRLILSWFPLHERGLAMGIRQTSQPLGIAFAAALFPLAAQGSGFHAPLGMVALGCAGAALLVVSTVPALAAASVSAHFTEAGRGPLRSPYARSPIWRMHGASALLTVAQFLLSVFGFVYLVSAQHWDPVAAGLFFTATGLAGAVMRVLMGWCSDRLGSRLHPLRWIAIALLLLLGMLSALAHAPAAAAPEPTSLVLERALLAALFMATVLSSSNNGLSYTLVAEYAGQRWAGRALGAQNTAQNAVAAVVPPLGALFLGAAGFGGLFLLGAVAAGTAALALPPSSRPSR